MFRALFLALFGVLSIVAVPARASASPVSRLADGQWQSNYNAPSGVRYGWSGFALLTAILSAGTVAGMVLFTWLTLTGVRNIKLGLLEKYESGLIGALLCAVGLLIILFEN